MVSRPSMNSQPGVASDGVVGLLKGPVAPKLRNPSVGLPPSIHASFDSVAYPSPKVLSSNAHRKTPTGEMRARPPKIWVAMRVRERRGTSPAARWVAWWPSGWFVGCKGRVVAV
jgi:hypothetical protein